MATLSATINNNKSSLSIEIISKRERKKHNSGLIAGYKFVPRKSRRRAFYDEPTAMIHVYLQNPLVSKYFGSIERDIALSLPHCQVFLAEVILETVASLARKK